MQSSKLRISLVVAFLLQAGCAAFGTTDTGISLTTKPDTPAPEFVFHWDHQLVKPSTFSTHPGEFAAPAHSAGTDEVVVGTSNGELTKLQASNGEILWQIRLKAALSSKPLVARNTVYASTFGGQFVALDLFSGETRWEVDLGTTAEATPVFSEGRVLVKDNTDVLRALDADTGEELWRYSRLTPEYFVMRQSEAIAVDAGEVFAGFSDGHLVSLQLETGELLWGVDLSAGAESLMDVNQAPIVREDSVIASSYSGGVYSLDRASGEINWRQALANITDLHHHQGFLYVTQAIGRASAYDADTGEPIWGFKLANTNSATGVVAFGPYLLLSTSEATYVLDRASGYPHNKLLGYSKVSSKLTFGADRLYMLSDRGVITAFQLGW